MDTAFFSAVLPPTGHYRLVLLPCEGRRRPNTLWADSIEALQALADSHAGQQRVYFGTASYLNATSGDAANVALNRALRLDIDAGPEKIAKHGDTWVYATQREALADLAHFTKETQLKPTFIVSSGAGWHIYYALAEALTAPAWRVLAERLYLLCQQHAIKVDNTTTCDVTRLLRVPGSQHENGSLVAVKGGTGRPYTLAELDALLPRAATPQYDAAALAVNDAFDERADVQYPPSSARKLFLECPELRAVLAKRGNVPEPLWRTMLGLLKFTVEGEALAHSWSAGYSGYSHAETQRKLDAWHVGPPTMEEFAKYVPELMQSKWWGKVKSPIQLGVMTDQEQEALPPEQRTTTEAPAPAPDGHPWDGMLPEDTRVIPYEDKWQLQYRAAITKSDGHGGVATERQWVTITTTPFWFVKWGTASSNSNALVQFHALIDGRVRTYEMDQTCFASQKDLIKFFASRAVHTPQGATAEKNFYIYAKKQFQTTQMKTSDTSFTDRFGLHVLDSGELVALQGRHVIAADGTIHDCILSARLRENAESFSIPLPQDNALQEAWPADVWDTHILPRAQRHVEFLRHHFGTDALVSYQLAIMAILASPFMAFVTGEWRAGRLPSMCTLNLSLYSRQGGQGKTAACQAAALAFGPPSMVVVGQGDSAATSNYRNTRLSVSGTLPSVMDEVGSLSAAQVFNLLSLAANGTARGRTRQDGSMAQTSPWALTNVLTTNRSLYELLMAPGAGRTDAVQRRILEIDVGAVPAHDLQARTEYAKDYSQIVAGCTGALGAVLHRELCRMGVDSIHALTAQCVEKAAKLLGAGQADRFIYRGLGAIIACGQVLHNAGLLPFSLRAVAEEYRRAYDASLKSIEQASIGRDPLQLLNQMLYELLPYTLITQGKGDPSHLEAPLNLRLPTEVKARHVLSERITYIAASAVRTWAAENGAGANEMLETARRIGAVVQSASGSTTRLSRKFDLTIGTSGDTQQRVYTYAIRPNVLADFLGLEDDAPSAVPSQSSNVVKLPAPPKPDASPEQSSTSREAQP